MKFEYRVLQIPHSELEFQLNARGEAGWELVGSERFTSVTLVILMRRVAQ